MQDPKAALAWTEHLSKEDRYGAAAEVLRTWNDKVTADQVMKQLFEGRFKWNAWETLRQRLNPPKP